MDGGVYDNFSKQFPSADVTAVIAFANGIPIGYMEGWDDQKITGCLFVRGREGSLGYVHVHGGDKVSGGGKVVPPAEVDPVVLSEVLGDLATVAAKGK
jgi:hypothetical protein